MTLEQLANDISASADAEAKATIKAAKAEAEAILTKQRNALVPLKEMHLPKRTKKQTRSQKKWSLQPARQIRRKFWLLAEQN